MSYSTILAQIKTSVEGLDEKSGTEVIDEISNVLGKIKELEVSDVDIDTIKEEVGKLDDIKKTFEKLQTSVTKVRELIDSSKEDEDDDDEEGK